MLRRSGCVDPGHIFPLHCLHRHVCPNMKNNYVNSESDCEFCHEKMDGYLMY